MNYRVRWRRRALDRLTTLWLEADSATRQALTAANHLIDTALSQNPYAVGESRSKGRRLALLCAAWRLFPR